MTDTTRVPLDIGNWVRFYQRGVLVIGVIEYLEKDNLGVITVSTDIGQVNAKYILEVR